MLKLFFLDVGDSLLFSFSHNLKLVLALFLEQKVSWKLINSGDYSGAEKQYMKAEDDDYKQFPGIYIFLTASRKYCRPKVKSPRL